MCTFQKSFAFPGSMSVFALVSKPLGKFPMTGDHGGLVTPEGARRAPSTTPAVSGDAVAVVDAAHARLVGSVPVTAPPGAIAYGAGSIWVSFPDSRSVSRISPESRRGPPPPPPGVGWHGPAACGGSVWGPRSGDVAPFR